MKTGRVFTFAGDESGDTSFSFSKGASRYFVVAMIATDQPDELRKHMQDIKKTLNLPEEYEYKFHKLTGKRRAKEIISQIALQDFRAWAIVIDKTSLDDSFKFLSGVDFYLYFVTELVRGIPSEERFGATLILDEFGKQLNIATAARKVMRARNIASGFKRIVTRDSKIEPMIQLADLIAGAVSHRDSHKDANMAELLQSKLKGVIEFPYH